MKTLPHLLVLALCLPLFSSAEARATDPLSASRAGPEAGIIVVAHRGDWRNFPENSLPALESCIGLGLGMVEIDVRRTKDGHFVLMHDETVDRTTTGKGRVSDLTVVEIGRLRLRDGLGMPTVFAVPTLPEALRLARGRIRLNLDKAYEHLEEIWPVLEETGMTSQVVLKGTASVAEFRARYAKLRDRMSFMPVIRFREAEALDRTREWLQEAEPEAIEFVFDEWTAQVADAFALCRARGVGIWVNTLWPHLAGGLSDDLALSDPAAVYGRLVAQGATIIQTDRPRELLAYLKGPQAREPAR